MSYDENIAWREHVPKGWHGLYEKLLLDIASWDASAKVEQAKEKFGELRVYLDRSDEAIGELIDAASRVSRRTCQRCSAEALLCLRKDHYMTLCERHRAGFVVASVDPIVMTLRVSEAGVEIVDRASLQFGQDQGPKDIGA